MEARNAPSGAACGGACRAVDVAGRGGMRARIVASIVLAGLAVAMSGCSTVDGPYKPREKDPNAGGNGSMYKASERARSW